MTNETVAAPTARALRTARQVETLKGLRYGVEIEFTNVGRETVAAALAGAWGATYAAYIWHGVTCYRVTLVDGRSWTVVGDASVSGSAFGRGGELVSPILTWTDMERLQDAVRILRGAGAKVDTSCGMHVHVDGARFKSDPAKVRDLMAFAYRWERVVFAAVRPCAAREHGVYMKKLDVELVERFRRAARPRSVERAGRLWYGGEIGFRHHYDGSRYRWVNVHALFDKGTVEFRLFDATLHAGRVKANVILALGVVAAVLTKRSVSWSARAAGTVEGTGQYAGSAEQVTRLLVHPLQLGGSEFETARGHLTGRFDRRPHLAREAA